MINVVDWPWALLSLLARAASREAVISIAGRARGDMPNALVRARRQAARAGLAIEFAKKPAVPRELPRLLRPGA